MPTKWYDAKVIRIEDASSITRRFWLKLDREEPVSFTAGQFFTFDLPIHEKRTKRWRSYSIASEPGDDNVFEFCIVHLEGGAGTHYLFNEIEVGSTIRMKGPSGVFVLPEPVETDLVFICTGTGVAPFRSMIKDHLRRGKPLKNVHLIYGTRYAENILYQAEFEALQNDWDGFRYSVALSREPDLSVLNAPFELKKGYVHQYYTEEYREVRPDIQFYLCGWRNMIDEAVETLRQKMGYDRTQVVFELYG
jgi:CDP-4-dehydro-6-deoxyglucose reductase